MKRKIFCMISIVLILISSFIPAYAEIVSYEAYASSIYTGNSWPDLWWDSSVPIPRLDGETDQDLKNVHIWIGLEYMSDNTSSGWLSDGVFEAMRAGMGDYGGYYIEDYGGGVYAYNPSSSNGVVWNDVSKAKIQSAANHYYAQGNSHLGIDGTFYEVDSGGKSRVSANAGLDYGTFFLSWLFNYYTPTNEDSGSVLAYSLYSNNGAFAVRWTARSVETSNLDKFCYIGICAPQTRSGSSGDSSARLINLGKNAHPFFSGGGSDSGDLYDRISQLQHQIGQMESDHASEIAALNSAHEEALINGRNESYHLGYNAGIEDSKEGISFDTSDPVKAILGFFAVLFKGLRDFIMPILGVEIAGISILTLVGVIGLILFVGLVIVLIAKVRGG